MNIKSLLKKLNAYSEGVDCIAEQSAIDAWNNCDQGDWMLCIAKKQGIDLKVLTLAKVRCARLVEHLMTDQRSINALVAAEKFANGEITREELDAAAYAANDAANAANDAANAAYAANATYSADAADAAYAAADASTAYDVGTYDAAAAAATASCATASRKETLLKCANICRETIPFDLLKIEESQC